MKPVNTSFDFTREKVSLLKVGTEVVLVFDPSHTPKLGHGSKISKGWTAIQCPRGDTSELS